MKKIYFIFALSLAAILSSCGGSEKTDNKEALKSEEVASPAELAASYCECLTSSPNTDSCMQLSKNYALKLATNNAALDSYNNKTEECLNAKLEADMKKATEGMEELEENLTTEE